MIQTKHKITYSPLVLVENKNNWYDRQKNKENEDNMKWGIMKLYREKEKMYKNKVRLSLK